MKGSSKCKVFSVLPLLGLDIFGFVWYNNLDVGQLSELNSSYLSKIVNHISGCGAVGDVAEVPPVAGEARHQEWQ